MLLFSAPPASAVDSVHLQLEVTGINAERGGDLVIALFDREGTWPKHDSALRRKTIAVRASSMRIALGSIEVDREYAIQVFHDQNGNGKLDFRWFPYPRPKEAVGVSNNNRKLGPPSFEKALFRSNDLNEALVIQLQN